MMISCIYLCDHLSEVVQEFMCDSGVTVEENNSTRCDESPIACMQRENKLLVARYTSRLKAASTAIQRQNLQLELGRALTENAAIARQRQEVWEQHRNEVAAHCHKIADM
jgi:hypothetical protein